MRWLIPEGVTCSASAAACTEPSLATASSAASSWIGGNSAVDARGRPGFTVGAPKIGVVDARHRAADPLAAIGSLLNPPPLHSLLAFEAAARSLSLAKAAGELRITPSALAQAIALLEDRVGLQLVRVLSPTVELTEVGQRYSRAVQQFTHGLRDGLHQRLPDRRAQLRITASQALARLWLAPRLGGFVRAHPRIELVLASTAQIQTIGHGGVDIGLRYGQADDDRLLATTLWTDRLVAAGAPRLAPHPLSPSELGRRMPLIDHAVARWSPWLAAADALPSDLRPALVCSDLHLAIEAACQGIGFVLAPSRMLERKLERGELRIASRHDIAARPYQAVVAREQAARPPVRAFLQWLLSEVAAQERRLQRKPVAPAD